jgi:hypothetical protein
MKGKGGGGKAKSAGPASSDRFGAVILAKDEKAQLAAMKKVLDDAQVAVEELRRARKVDAKSLSEPFTV